MFQREVKASSSSSQRPGSNDGFSWRDKRPRKNYGPPADVLGDISALYGDEPIVGDSSGLVYDCTMHIKNFIYNKNLPKAHRLLNLMIEKEVPPNEDTYIELMKGYSRRRRNDVVFELLEDMGNRGVMPTEKTLAALTNSFARTGDVGAALLLFSKMKTDYGVTPIAISYNSLLKSCVKRRKLMAAKTVLEDMGTSEVGKDVFTLTIMINVYAVCCNKESARQFLKECKDLIEEMENKDGVKANVLTFNTLLKLCARGSLTTEALDLLNEMKTKDLNPDIFTYATVIDGISKNEMLSTEEVLKVSSNVVDEMKKEGLQLDAYVYAVLMNLALRVKDLNTAAGLFNEMKNEGLKPNAAVFGIMIKCYEKLGDPSTGDAYLKPCLILIKKCEREGMKMEEPGYVSLLSACANVANLDAALKFWKKIEEQGVAKDVFLYNAMINVYISVEDLSGAVSLFSKMKRLDIKPNVITYGTMIKCYVKLGDPSIGDAYLRRCLYLLTECEQQRVKMDGPGYVSVLSACANVTNLDAALKVWNKIEERGVAKDVFLFNAMINVYISAKDINGALSLFSKMKKEGLEPSVVTYGTMMKCYEKLGDPSTGDAYLKPCLALLKECEREGINMDAQGFISLLNDCANVANLDVALKVWNKIEERGVANDVFLCTAMLNVYISVGDLSGAVSLFSKMKNLGIKPSVITYGTMMKCYEKLGDPSAGDIYLKPCLDLLTECEREGINLDGSGFVSLLSACVNVANLDIALKVWKKINEQGVEPNVPMYTAMINVYISAGDLSGAVSLFSKMKSLGIKPNVITYGTMMKCYEKLGDPSAGNAYLKPCLDLLAECEHEGIKMDEPGYVSLLSACANVANLDKALEIWSKMIEAKWKPDVFVYSAMISVCLSVDAVDRAFALLDEMKTSGVQPNEVTYRTFIPHFMKKKDRSGAQRIYNIMKSLAVQPDKNTSNMLKALKVI